MKRFAILLLCLVFVMTTCVMPTFAVEKVSVTTPIVVDNAKVLTVSGSARALPGTNVMIIVGYPKADLKADIAAGADLDDVALTLDQLQLDANKEFSYTYTLDADEKSGILPVYVNVYGFDTVKVDARFENADRAAAAFTAISDPTATDADVLAALIEYDTDINIEDGYKFSDKLDATGKNYVAEVINTKTLADLQALKDAFNAEIYKYTTFLEMKEANREQLKTIFDANIDKFTLDAADKATYEGYVANKKANTIIALYTAIKNCVTPDDLALAFKQAVIKGGQATTTPTTPSGSRPSGSQSSMGESAGSTNDVTLQPEGDLFNDLNQTEWARTAIEALAADGIINGKADGVFAPNDNVTREEFVKMLVLAFSLEADGYDVNFTDVNKNEWYYKYIVSGVKQGIVKGISDTAFGIGMNITRQDMATLIHRAAVLDGTVAFYHARDVLFSDASSIADYAKEAVTVLSEANYLNGMGDGTFAPQANCTRAEAAVAIYNILYK